MAKQVLVQRTVLITGSGGLIGSQAVEFFIDKDFQVVGIDNNMRQYFFGPEGSTLWNSQRLMERYHQDYTHIVADIRDDKAIEKVFREHRFDLIIHTAAQPSHDWAAK